MNETKYKENSIESQKREICLYGNTGISKKWTFSKITFIHFEMKLNNKKI